MYSEPRPWKRLISDITLSKHERVSLITCIFSDSNEVESVRLLSGDDAQAFIDVIDEVSVHTFLTPDARMVGSQDNVLFSSFKRLGFGASPTTGILEVFALFV